MDEFIKDRIEAFTSMDKEKILAYCRKYKITLPKDEVTFWAGVHKAVCNLYLLEEDSISKEQYDKSYDWLAEHGYNPSISIN